MSHCWSRMVAVLVLLAGGCGISDYEDKMFKEQKKQDQRDEQATFLGEPAEIKVLAEQSGTTPAVDVFFRVPKGINPTPNSIWGGIYQQHGKKRPERRARGAPAAPESPFLDVYITAMPAGDWKEFTDKAQQPFQGMAHTEFTRAPKTPLGRPPMDLQTTTYTDSAALPTSFIVYFYQAPQARVAIAFRVYKEKTDVAEVRKTVDVCMQTLAVGNDAGATRQSQNP